MYFPCQNHVNVEQNFIQNVVTVTVLCFCLSQKTAIIQIRTLMSSYKSHAVVFVSVTENCSHINQNSFDKI